MSLRSLLLALLTLHVGGPPAFAAEVVVLNDSTVGGTPSTVANVFLAGESTASYLTSTCDGDIVAAQVYWTSQFGGQPTQVEQMLSIFGAGVFPAPGAVLQNEGGGNAEILGPQLVDGIMNEFRFLDPPTNAVPMKVPVTTGQVFAVSLQFVNQSSGNPFAASVVYDQDGCQAQTNAAFVIPGGWNDACPLGITGDWVIRAVIACDEVVPPPSAIVPALGARGAFALAAMLATGGSVAAHAARRRRVRRTHVV